MTNRMSVFWAARPAARPVWHLPGTVVSVSRPASAGARSQGEGSAADRVGSFMGLRGLPHPEPAAILALLFSESTLHRTIRAGLHGRCLTVDF